MRIALLLAVLTAAALPALPAHSAENEKFAIYYAAAAPNGGFKPYQLVVLDGIHHPPLQPLKEADKTVLGYISLGEVNQNDASYAELKSHNLILQENPNWKGNYYVDLRDPLWAKIVLENLIPDILRQGFDGLFLDTLDDAVDLEQTNPAKFAGMKDAAAHLVQAIRMHYPSIKIMMNRAYDLLPKVGSDIDMELGESVYTTYDFGKKSYRKVSESDYYEQVKALQQAKHNNPQLKIYTLDYADPSDSDNITDIYRTERANGFIPYVATIGLDKVVEEPRP